MNVKKPLNILPYALIRTGGGSILEFENLVSKNTIVLIDKLIELNETILASRDILSDKLRELPSLVADNKVKKILINGRRELYNQKLLKEKKIEVIKSVMSSEDNRLLFNYLEKLKYKGELIKNIQSSYEEEVGKKFPHLIRLFSGDNLKKGLVLSSSSLLAKANSIKDISWKNLRKKDHQIVLGLLKYLTRMYCKTSPFSTFTLLSSARLKKNISGFLESKILDSEKETESHIRLNNYLWAYIRTLLTINENTNKLFNIRLNPTLKYEKENFLFLVNHLNEESFQRIPINPLLEYIRKEIKNRNTPHTLKSLLSQLVDDEVVDAEPNQIEDYLKQLIKYGFIEFDFGISGVDTDWDMALVNLLNTIKDSYKYFPELIDCLKKLRRLREKRKNQSIMIVPLIKIRKKKIVIPSYKI